MSKYRPEDIKEFELLLQTHRYDYVKLAYLIFGFGEPGTDMEDIHLYTWQIEELEKISKHLRNPLTRYITYKLIVSSGNGAAKTALGAIINIILLYTSKLRGRLTANTDTQLKTVVWPEYDVWFRRARFNDYYFDKQGTSIKAVDEQWGNQWRLDHFNWSEETPAAVSGLHNKGHAISYTFEEAPGIPAVIFKYASGAFTDVNTIKIWMVFGNSDDPNSYFETLMADPGWNSRRIDTRTLDHVDKALITEWLRLAGGNEDHDDFRVRVRGLPRKTARDSIIGLNGILMGIEKGKTFDANSVRILPSILTVDPAWTGGDETTIWHHQGMYSCLLERYALDPEQGQDHSYTYKKVSEYERLLHVDRVLIDQGEGTALKTLANIDGKWHWELISFANSPNDVPEPKDSEYANIRAQMYYEANKSLIDGHVICVTTDNPEKDLEDIMKQLTWTKGTRHKTSLKKLAESKKDIKDRIGQSPDLADGFVLQFSRKVLDRLEENEVVLEHQVDRTTGDNSYKMPESVPNYDDMYS